jgi:hypothetical protein
MSGSARGHCNEETLRVFDLIGTYFVDMFYNHHYLHAYYMAQQQLHKTITDAYRYVLVMFVTGMRGDHDSYKKFVNGMFEFYRSKLGHLLFAEFQDRFLCAVVPEEYYGAFNSNDKDNAMKKILCDAARDLSKSVLEQNVLCMIIDDHENKANVSFLQEVATDTFIRLRDEYHSKFAVQSMRERKRGIIDITSYDKLKAIYLDTLRRKCELEAELERALVLIAKYRDNTAREDVVPPHDFDLSTQYNAAPMVQLQPTVSMQIVPVQQPAQVAPVHTVPAQVAPVHTVPAHSVQQPSLDAPQEELLNPIQMFSNDISDLSSAFEDKKGIDDDPW